MTFRPYHLIALAATVLLVINCKDPKPEVKEEIEVAAAEKKPVPKIIRELSAFTEISFSNPADIEQQGIFKLTGSKGIVVDSDMHEVAKICRQAMSSKKIVNYPIIEFEDSPKVVLMVQGKGFGGPIWGKLLLNKSEMTFEKIEFDHSAESEGYGAAMTRSSFEQQFTGVAIGSESFSFGLKQDNTTYASGDHLIDGISGATQTSISAVNMMNEALGKYNNYLSLLHNQKPEMQ